MQTILNWIILYPVGIVPTDQMKIGFWIPKRGFTTVILMVSNLSQALLYSQPIFSSVKFGGGEGRGAKKCPRPSSILGAN